MTTVTCSNNEVSDGQRIQIEGRINVLTQWAGQPGAFLSGDPRCGCGAPDAICEWDDIDYLEGLL